MLALTITSLWMISIIPSYNADESYGEESNKNIKLKEYINDRAGYKISYPSDATITEDNTFNFETTIADKKGNWDFSINAITYFAKSLEQTSKQSREEYKKENEPFKNKITDLKPLKVAGQPALMFDSISEFNGVKESYIDMIANNVLYSFYIEAELVKFDQYANMFFTMLKSFKLIN